MALVGATVSTTIGARAFQFAVTTPLELENDSKTQIAFVTVLTHLCCVLYVPFPMLYIVGSKGSKIGQTEVAVPTLIPYVFVFVG